MVKTNILFFCASAFILPTVLYAPPGDDNLESSLSRSTVSHAAPSSQVGEIGEVEKEGSLSPLDWSTHQLLYYGRCVKREEAALQAREVEGDETIQDETTLKHNQGHYERYMRKLRKVSLKDILRSLDKSLEVVSKGFTIALEDLRLVKNIICQDVIERRIKKGDMGAFYVKIQSLINGTHGYPEDKKKASALLESLIDEA